MAAAGTTRVAVSRRIDASATDVFAVLVDPRRHAELDGSAMVRGALTDAPIAAVGDVFVIEMYYKGLGSYQMDNHVVEFETDRRVAWEPVAGVGHPDAASAGARWGQRWSYDLAPDGLNATVVTETYDCSAAPADEREDVDDGRMWIEAMTATLERLDGICTGRAAG